MGEGKAFVEFESWSDVFLAGEVTLLSLLMTIMNLLLVELNLLNQPIVSCLEWVMHRYHVR
jgi:hypothetical protein